MGSLFQAVKAVVLVLALLLAAPTPAVAESPVEIELRFREGMEALERGETGAAIRAFREILGLDPDLHRVRLELARAHFLAEDWADARREFFVVLSADVPPPVKDNIVRFLRAIDDRRGWSWHLEAGLRGGPHGIRRYRSDTVTLDVAGQPLEFDIDRPDGPDFGAHVDGSVEFRHRFTEGNDGVTFSGIAGLSAGAVQYPGGDHDEQVLGGSLRLQASLPRTVVRFGPVLSRRWRGGRPLQDELAAVIGVEHRTTGAVITHGRLRAAHVEDHLVDARDGRLLSVRLGAARAWRGRSVLGASIEAGVLDARARFESYRFGRMVLSASTELGDGWAPSLDLGLAAWRFAERAPLFMERRKDHELRAQLELTKRNVFIGAFTPFAEIGISRRFSNIELFDYYETSYRFGLRRTL